jgi:lipoate-protein ligase A
MVDGATALRRSGASGVREWILWRDLAPRDGASNMAIDLALLGRAAQTGECWLRLYTWRPHCLSFGRNEPARRRYDRSKIERAALSVVRRPTGGRAVWHARELTYAVAAPVDAMGSLPHAYLEIHRMLGSALRRLGADASLAGASASSGLDAGACFSSPVGGELLVKGRKVVGSAQLREGGALLQHGSILLGDDQRLVGTVTSGGAPSDGSAPLGDLLGREVTADEAAVAVADAAKDRWGDARTDEPASPTLLAEAETHVARFRSDQWTWSR